MKARFKVGDTVTICQRVPGKHYKIPYYDSMALHAGKIGTVTEVRECDSYTVYSIHCSSYYWSEDMLDLVSKKKGEPSSPEPLDFIPKKKHYSFNFTV